MSNYDAWKATDSADEFLGPEPPPCEMPIPRYEQHRHPRYPSGFCVVCGAQAHEGCKWPGAEEWEAEQNG